MHRDAQERLRVRDELRSVGYKMDIDRWPPKVTLYYHKQPVTYDGAPNGNVGDALVGSMPGSPDYLVRKSRQGLFAYPPHDECKCRWCGERRASAVQPLPESTIEATVVTGAVAVEEKPKRTATTLEDGDR